MKNKTILVVEDEPSLRIAYETILKKHKYKVMSVPNGLEAYRTIKLRKPAVVILDLYMPVMDGITFLENFDTKDYPDTKVVVCTNLSGTELDKKLEDLQVDDVVLKSMLTPNSLVGVVERALSDKSDETRKTNKITDTVDTTGQKGTLKRSSIKHVHPK